MSDWDDYLSDEDPRLSDPVFMSNLIKGLVLQRRNVDLMFKAYYDLQRSVMKLGKMNFSDAQEQVFEMLPPGESGPGGSDGWARFSAIKSEFSDKLEGLRGELDWGNYTDLYYVVHGDPAMLKTPPDSWEDIDEGMGFVVTGTVLIVVAIVAAAAGVAGALALGPLLDKWREKSESDARNMILIRDHYVKIRKEFQSIQEKAIDGLVKAGSITEQQGAIKKKEIADATANDVAKNILNVNAPDTVADAIKEVADKASDVAGSAAIGTVALAVVGVVGAAIYFIPRKSKK